MLSPSSMVRDMRAVECRMFDRDNQLIGKVQMPPRGIRESPRRIEYQGRVFIEGDGSGFYGENEFAELVDV
jgi:hypothetical protein